MRTLPHAWGTDCGYRRSHRKRILNGDENPAFGALAKVLGAYGERVTKPGDLEGAIQRALASDKPALIDVMIDQNTLAPVVFKQ